MANVYGKRDLDVIKWCAARVSQAEIARRLGVSRQRVQQIEQRLKLGPRRGQNSRKKYSFICRECRREVFSSVPGRIFCSRRCFSKSRKVRRPKTELERRKEERLERNRLRAKNYYHNIFKQREDWQEVVRERNEKYAKQAS